MAVIGKIREKSTLLLVVLGISMLSFILGSNIFDSFIFKTDEDAAGYVGKTKIHINDFSTLQRQKEEERAIIAGELDENSKNQVSNEAWEEFMDHLIWDKVYEKLGLQLSPAEFNDMLVGTTMSSVIRQNFTNPETGKVDPLQVQQFFASIENSDNVPEDQQQMFVQRRTYGLYIQAFMRKERMVSKYQNLITKGLYVTNAEAKTLFTDQNVQASIRFVVKPYTAIADDQVTVTDKDIKEYFKKYSYIYKRKHARSAKFVVINTVPSSVDTAAVKTELEELIAAYSTTEEDTNFVYMYSETPEVPQYYAKGKLPFTIDSLLFNAPNGTVIGPVFDNGRLVLAKKLKSESVSDSVNARHILIQPTETMNQEQAKALRDSLLNVLKKGGDFGAIALQYSADKSNSSDAGNLGWFTAGQMVAEFNDVCFGSTKGDIKPVDTQFGFHIVEVLDKTKPSNKVLVSMINKNIIPSAETIEKNFNLASELSYFEPEEGKTKEEQFETMAMNKFLQVRYAQDINEATFNLQNMPGSQSVIKWILTSDNNSISEPIQVGNNYVVAIITSVRPDGIPAMEEIKEELKTATIKHKKGQMIVDEFNTALNGASKLEDVAGKLNLQVNSAFNVNFASIFVQGAGAESKLVGSVFGSPANKISKAVEGANGVYVFVKDNELNNAQSDDFSYAKMQLTYGIQSRVDGEIRNVMIDKLQIRDLRYKFN